MNETIISKHTLRTNPVWVRITASLNNGSWDVKIKPDVPTLEKIFGKTPTDEQWLLKKLASAKTISKTEKNNDTMTIIVWSQRFTLFRHHHDGIGIRIDNEDVTSYLG